MSEYYYNIHNIIKFRLVSKKNDWLRFLERQFAYFRSEAFDDYDLDFQIDGIDMANMPEFQKIGKYHIAKDVIYWDNWRKFGQWRVAIKDLEKTTTIVYFEGNWLSCKYLFYHVIEPLLYFKLSLKGHLLLHSSCVSDGKNAYAFPALLGTGKTSLMLALLQRGVKEYMADDFTIFSAAGITFNYPTPISLFDYNVRGNPFINDRLSCQARTRLRFNSWLYSLSLGYTKPPLHMDVATLFPGIAIGDQRRLAAVCLLKKTADKDFTIKENIDIKGIIPTLMRINMFEFGSFLNFVDAYCYLNPYKEVAAHWQRSEANLTALLRTIACHEISIPASFTYQNERFLKALSRIVPLP